MDKLKQALALKTIRAFFIGKCKLTVASLDGKVLGLQGVRIIESKYRGTGEASRALTELFHAVDLLHVTTMLEVQPMDKKTNVEGLLKLYSRFGFRKVRDKDGYLMMKRLPKRVQSVASSPINEASIFISIGGYSVSAEGTETNDREEDKDLLRKWKSLVNMSASEIKKFLATDEGKKAGLSRKEASSQGISSGHDSARAIIRMKSKPVSQWTNDDWEWCRKQVNFITRMSGNRGKLYDEDGNKTRKHTSLLLWGHKP
jgi:hypothetical protein